MAKITLPYELKLTKLSTLKPHPAQKKSREIDDQALAGLSGSIEEFGLLEEIIANKKTGRIVSGHQRWKVLKDDGAKEAPVKWIDVDEKRERAIFFTLNNQEIAGHFTAEAKSELLVIETDLPDLWARVGLSDLKLSLDMEPPPLGMMGAIEDGLMLQTLNDDSESTAITFVLPKSYRTKIERGLSKNGKDYYTDQVQEMFDAK